MALRNFVGISAVLGLVAACGGSISSDLLAPFDGGGSGVDGGHSTSGSGSGTAPRSDSGTPGMDAQVIQPGFDSSAPPYDAFVAPVVDSWVAPTGGGIVCGAIQCTTAQECCLEGAGGGGTDTCIAKGGTCGGATVSCLSPTDCGGNACCVAFQPYGVSCASGGDCPNDETPICNLANNNADCPNGELCQQLSDGYGYCTSHEGTGSGGFPGH